MQDFGQEDPDRGRAFRRTVDGEPAAEPVGPLAHRVQPDVTRVRPRRGRSPRRRRVPRNPGRCGGVSAGILVAGRWAGERHPDVVSPDRWTRDLAAEYVADTLQAVGGQWAPNNRNRSGWGKPLSAAGKA